MTHSRCFRPMAACIPLLLAVAVSCSTSPAPQDVATLSAAKLAQAAQGAADKGGYQLAIEYYKAIRDRFPEEVEGGLWASYEIAFLTHKMGKDEEAIALFDELIGSYAARNDPALPQGPLILAKKVRQNLLDKRAAASGAAGRTAAPAPTPAASSTPSGR